MTPVELAELHAVCFTTPRPWNEQEFADFLASDRTILCTAPDGFALGQCAGPEAELLTIAVRPEAQGRGQGRALLSGFLSNCRDRDIEDVFLEVAVDNTVAIALYRAAGFTESGRRKDYYRRANGQRVSCLLMRRTLVSA